MKKTILSIILAASSGVVSIAENPAVLYMIGGATEGAWNWDQAAEMKPVADHEGEYSYTGNMVVGDFKICAEKDYSFSASYYRPSSADCNISKEGVTDGKVVYTTTPDDKWNVTEVGRYTITININTMTLSALYLGATVKAPIETDALYLLGDAAPCGWNIDVPTPCVKEDNNVFVYEGKLKKGSMQAILLPGSANWGAKFIIPTFNGCKISKAGVEGNEFDYSADHSNSWNVEEEGDYRLAFDLNNWTLAVSSTTGINGIEPDTDEDAAVEYYNLQGVRVYDPANGLYLKRQGEKVSKVIIK